jgi:hypothetical protein
VIDLSDVILARAFYERHTPSSMINFVESRIIAVIATSLVVHESVNPQDIVIISAYDTQSRLIRSHLHEALSNALPDTTREVDASQFHPNIIEDILTAASDGAGRKLNRYRCGFISLVSSNNDFRAPNDTNQELSELFLDSDASI